MMPAANARGFALALTVLLLVGAWFARDTLLAVFAGTLLAIVLRAIAAPLRRALRVPEAAGVWLAVAIVVLILAAGAYFMGSAVSSQFEQLRASLPWALHSFAARVADMPVSAWIAGAVPGVSSLLPDAAHLVSGATGILSGAVATVAVLFIVVFVGITGALEPTLYRDGFLRLFPAVYRDRLGDALDAAAAALRVWLVARGLTMLATGALVAVGLWALRIPLPVALGALAGLLAFVPNVGAFVAATPAVIFAFASGPATAIEVAGMYVLVHVIDDWVLSPLVERSVVKLAPIVTLVAQVLLGIVAGIVGVMLAAPLVAMATVLVVRLWPPAVGEDAR
jgi:predicted PurR-regulated permease PerM